MTRNMSGAGLRCRRWPVSRPGQPWGDQMDERRILVVDDDSTNRLVARMLLERRGFSVIEAESGAEALDIVAAGGCDLVLMDLSMPEMDGFETTRRLREAPGAVRHLPIVALTAHTSAVERKACLDCGMDGFLEKPFNLELALHTIEFLLNDRVDGRA